jgi:hypothetical protein
MAYDDMGGQLKVRIQELPENMVCRRDFVMTFEFSPDGNPIPLSSPLMAAGSNRALRKSRKPSRPQIIPSTPSRGESITAMDRYTSRVHTLTSRNALLLSVTQKGWWLFTVKVGIKKSYV